MTGKFGGANAYARHRGVSCPAVLKALARGTIKAALVSVAKDSRGKNAYVIDFDTADRLWNANTDAAQRRDQPPAPAQFETTPAASTPQVLPGQDLFGQPLVSAVNPEEQKNQGETFAAVRAERERWSGQLARLRFEEQSGELVPRTRVHELFVKLARSTRDKVLAIPVRVSHTLAAESSPAVIEQRLSEELEAALRDIAKGLERGIAI